MCRCCQHLCRFLHQSRFLCRCRCQPRFPCQYRVHFRFLLCPTGQFVCLRYQYLYLYQLQYQRLSRESL
ncbi:MAG TPA: hypothetical protein VGJ92_02385 [Methanocella sp.]